MPGARELVAALADVYRYPASAAPGGGWVRGNMIASVDGAIALDGRSGGLSGVADRLVFWLLRSLADVIVVGAGTAREEGYGQVSRRDVWPELRAGRSPVPPVAVLTRSLDLPLNGRLFGGRPGCEESPRTIVLTTAQVPAERRAAAARVAEVVVAGERDVTASAAVTALAARGYGRILTEGGPRLLGELSAAGMLDELCLTISPVLEGGRSPTRALAAPPGPAGPAGPVRLRLGTLLEDDGYLFARYVRDQPP